MWIRTCMFVYCITFHTFFFHIFSYFSNFVYISIFILVRIYFLLHINFHYTLFSFFYVTSIQFPFSNHFHYIANLPLHSTILILFSFFFLRDIHFFSYFQIIFSFSTNFFRILFLFSNHYRLNSRRIWILKNKKCNGSCLKQMGETGEVWCKCQCFAFSCCWIIDQWNVCIGWTKMYGIKELTFKFFF